MTATTNTPNKPPAGAKEQVAVVGLGYVGLPLAHAASGAGLKVVGFDVSPDVVASLNHGVSHVDDFSDEDIKRMLDAGFVATSRPEGLENCSIFVICVPTPLAAGGGPDLSYIEQAGRLVASLVRSGSLVVLESTSYPGTTEEVLAPLLQASGLTPGVDFNLAFSPERIDPGNSSFQLRNTPKLVAGLTPSCLEKAGAFYERLVDQVVPVAGLKEAELAKLLENTYRQVNIALANEMARFCHEMGIDVWEAIQAAATKPFGFSAFYPGPGVGGHCIPIDPNYLGHKVAAATGKPFRFVELAHEINQSMPDYVAYRAEQLLVKSGGSLTDANVLLVGVTYKPDLADDRESPAYPLADHIEDQGGRLGYVDPYVKRWRQGSVRQFDHTDLAEACAWSDLVIVLQPHSSIDLQYLQSEAPLILDTRGRLSGEGVRL